MFYYAYIMASHRRVIYIGFTSRLQARVWEHKHDVDADSFTARYRVHKLVHFERYSRSLSAIAREKELKGWSRAKKLALINAHNPKWRDLSAGWGRRLKMPLLKRRS